MKVSVSLVTYNHERFVGQALDGILMQETDFDFEIVAGDDFSTDGTRDIIRGYQRRFPDKIRTVFPDRNLGDSGRLMFVETIKLCSGRYIAMLDGDDYWTAPDKLQRQSDFLDAHPECSLCYHDAVLVADGADLPSWQFIPPGHPRFATTEDLLDYCFIPACSAMVRREVADEFPDWFFAGPWADTAFYIMASEQGSLGLIDEKMGAYRIHPGSVWSSLDAASQIRSDIAVLDGLGDRVKQKYRRAIARSKARQHLLLANELMRRGPLLDSVRHLAKAVALYPTFFQRGYASLARSLLARASGRLPSKATAEPGRFRPTRPG